MSDPLRTRLARLRTRARQVMCVYGLSWVVAVLFGATLVVGGLDWLVHLDDAGVRFILGMTILVAAGWVAWRYLISPLRRSLSDVDLAMRIEERNRQFNDGLTSTVEFLESGTDARFGSPELQQKVIEDTVRQIDRVNVDDVVETRPVRRAACAAIAVCLVVAGVVGLNRAAAAVALNRLVFPFSAGEWPRSTDLRLLRTDFTPLENDPEDPLRVARGDTLNLYVENSRGDLPDDVAMEYDFGEEGDKRIVREPLRRTTVRNAAGESRDVCITNWTVKGPVRFRAVGGDDRRMPWQVLKVVPPPLVEDLHVMLTPPAYTGRPKESLPAAVGHVKGVVGTKVSITARVNKPVGSARLRTKDRAPVDVALDSDGRTIAAAFEIDRPGVYSWWFDLRDQQGFENADAPRYEIRGVADSVPEVRIDKPETDLQVTADAIVSLEIFASDDLGLSQLRIPWQIGVGENPVAGIVPTPPLKGQPEHTTVVQDWNLAELPLTAGLQVTFHAEATDAYDLGDPHVGRSIRRTLTVVSPEEKTAELAARQADLLDTLEKLAKEQTRAADQTDELITQLNTVGSLRPEDVDLLKRIELDQRQITSRLTNPADGVESQVDELRTELEHNRLDAPEIERRLRRMADELKLLREEPLPQIESELTRARKSARIRDDRNADRAHSSDVPRNAKADPTPDPRDDEAAAKLTANGKTPATNPPEPNTSQKDRTKSPPDTKDRPAADPLRRVRDDQRVVLESLESMLDQLSEWRNQQNLANDFQELIAGQESLSRDTAEARKQTLNKDVKQLTPQEQAELSKLADRQTDLGDRATQLQNKLDETALSLDKHNPAAADALRDLKDELTGESIAGRMRETARELRGNQVGRAEQQQQQILNALKEMRDALENQPLSDVETLVKRMKQAESELDELRKKQEDLLEKVEESQNIEDPAEREQQLQKLRKEQEQLQREAARRAAERMQQAGEALGRENAQGADDAAAMQQEALDDLEQAQRELAHERERTEEQLAQEMLERAAEEIEAMVARQDHVINETRRIEGLRKPGGNLGRPQLKSLRDLEAVQRGLEQETLRLAETLKTAEVFALAVEGAARNMRTAADRMSEKLTDEKTIAAETAAKQRFVDLVNALKKEDEKAADAQQKQGENGEEQEQPKDAPPPTDGIPHIAQLKMLKTLQENLLNRTSQLDALREKNGKLDESEQKEVKALSDEQGRLADLVRNMAEKFVQAAEEQNPTAPEPKAGDETKEDPDSKPDLDLDLEDEALPLRLPE